MNISMLESFTYIIPSIVVGIISYFFFKSLIANSASNKNIEMLVGKKKDTLRIKLNAYERMLLFCERINPSKLLLRVKPNSDNVSNYLQLLIANIEQEFEHNMVQQIYISDSCWSIIVTSKGAFLNKLREISNSSGNANEMREAILIYYSKELSPSDTAISVIKNEVKKLM